MFPLVFLKAITFSIIECGPVGGVRIKIQLTNTWYCSLSVKRTKFDQDYFLHHHKQRLVGCPVDGQSRRARFKTALKMLGVLHVDLAHQTVNFMLESIGPLNA